MPHSHDLDLPVAGRVLESIRWSDTHTPRCSKALPPPNLTRLPALPPLLGKDGAQVIPVACEEEVAEAGELAKEAEHMFKTSQGAMV